VDDDQVMVGAEQDAVFEAGLAAAGFVRDVVQVAGGDGLVAAAGEAAVLVPQPDRVADPGRDIFAEPDVQGQAGAAESGAELPAA